MKKVSILISILLLVGILGAIDFNYEGELLTRGAAYNDPFKNDGGDVNTRLRIGLDSNITNGLDFRAAFQIGEIYWGDNNSGGNVGTNGVNIKTSELYLDYLMQSINSNIKVGLQYWADHRGLILDDYFAGVMLTKDLSDMNLQVGLLKNYEGFHYQHDDYTVLLGSLTATSPVDWGVNGFIGYNDIPDDGEVTLLPYATLEVGPATLDLTPFLCYQFINGDDNIGLGAAINAKFDLAPVELGADVLCASKNALVPYSHYYHNGLFIYGINLINDGLNLYWNDNIYHNNQDALISAVGSFRFPVADNYTLFAAAGIVSDQGMELNGGVECKLIEDILNLDIYGAVGDNDNSDVTNYAVGTTLQLNFK
ncbi:MAG: hypothetical protein ABFC98_00170 [Candidatus Cloacimonas sp.]